MASYVPCKKNDTNGNIFYVSLVSQADTNIFQANPTLAAGDVKIAIDDGAPANLGTLPAVDGDFTKRVKVTLSQAETNGDNLTIIFSDAAGAEWCDLTINIQTSAQTLDEVDTNVDSILTDTAVIGALGAGLTAIPWNSDWDAEVESEVTDSLEAHNLDHLMKTGDATLTNIVADNTALAHLMASGADISDYVSTTDSLEAFRDHVGDGTNLTEAGGDGDHLTEAGGDGDHLTEAGGDGDHLTEAGGDGDHLAEAGGTGDHLTDLGGMSTSMKGEVEAECTDAIEADGLDHLVAAAVTGTDITDDSIIAKLVSKDATADWDDFVNTTDALQAIRDKLTDIETDTDVIDDGTSGLVKIASDVAAILVDTGTTLNGLITTLDTVADGIQTDLSNATDGLGALKALIDAVDAVVDAILVDTAVIGALGAGLTAIPWNSSWDAEVQSECNDALVALKLDHLIAVAESDDPVNNSIVAKMAASDGDWSGFSAATDALEAIADDMPVGYGSGAVTFIYTVYDQDSAVLPDCLVWVTSDAAGSTIVAESYSNSNGQCTFYLDDATTYYFWRRKHGYSFTDPDVESVSA